MTAGGWLLLAALVIIAGVGVELLAAWGATKLGITDEDRISIIPLVLGYAK
jgi:hypothetical protein